MPLFRGGGGMRGALGLPQLSASLQSPPPSQTLLSVHHAGVASPGVSGLHRQSRGRHQRGSRKGRLGDTEPSHSQAASPNGMPGGPCTPHLLPVEGSCPLSAPCFGCPRSQRIPLSGSLEMLQQGWPGHPPQHPSSPCQRQPHRTSGSQEQGRAGARGLGWDSRAPTVGRDEPDPPRQVKVDVTLLWLHE